MTERPGNKFTLFTVPKPFEGRTSLSQQNAIRSWLQLPHVAEVLLLGNEPGVADFAASSGARQIPFIERNEFGTPLIPSIFKTAELESRSQLFVYINTDIILTPGFTDVLRAIPMRPYLAVGRRCDLRLDQEIAFDRKGWDRCLLHEVEQRGRRHSLGGMDYFAFTRGLWPKIPSFALGRFAWDNWLVAAAVRSGIDVIDLSRAATIVHQDHDYSHIVDYRPTRRDSPEARHNRRLAGVHVHYSARDAKWRMCRDQTGKCHLVPNRWRIAATLRRLLKVVAARAAGCFETSTELAERPVEDSKAELNKKQESLV